MSVKVSFFLLETLDMGFEQGERLANHIIDRNSHPVEPAGPISAHSIGEFDPRTLSGVEKLPCHAAAYTHEPQRAEAAAHAQHAIAAH